jgi:hypothetical protein
MPPSGYEVSARTFEVERRMQGLIRTSLMDKGYVHVPSNGELLIRFGVSNVHEDIDDEWSGYQRQDWGRLEIDAYDASTKLQVWRNVGIARIDPKKIDDRVLVNAVQLTLAMFPARSDSAANGAPQSPDAKIGRLN